MCISLKTQNFDDLGDDWMSECKNLTPDTREKIKNLLEKMERKRNLLRKENKSSF